MNFNDAVRLVLERKGSNVFSVEPETPVYDAMREMSTRDIGALLVTKDDHVVGIFSERDYARKVILLGRSSKETTVQEIMSPVVSVARTDSIDSCLHLMTSARIRYLAVMDENGVAGMISIGDLVNWMLSAQAETIEQLHSYIAADYPR